ncbi:hypothetical protein QWY82_01000 [Simiduia curdlanivorans]|uniref:Uncharacterized protein n=1 Tax=Simiduia curdlanivorans TaxID=1492769 RepID=A0ABV8V5H9_9GAMM|nr:hypothetical protein [Simiduia curdlanivorans]MDN3637372.1 hypothetical protein [Simiduia curdlanivorans]
MPRYRCEQHRFESDFLFRCGNIDRSTDWAPKNPRLAQRFYEILRSDDMMRIAAEMSDSLMTHSLESSKDSPYISTASCPHCLLATEDDEVQAIMARYEYRLYSFLLPVTGGKRAFSLAMTGDTVGGHETEQLVITFPGTSLLDYWTGGFIAPEQAGPNWPMDDKSKS